MDKTKLFATLDHETDVQSGIVGTTGIEKRCGKITRRFSNGIFGLFRSRLQRALFVGNVFRRSDRISFQRRHFSPVTSLAIYGKDTGFRRSRQSDNSVGFEKICFNQIYTCF